MIKSRDWQTAGHFVNWVLLEHHPAHSVMYCLWLFSVLHGRISSYAEGIHTTHNVFTICPLEVPASLGLNCGSFFHFMILEQRDEGINLPYKAYRLL